MFMLGFVAQNPRNGTLGPCYTNTDVSGRRSAKRERTENWHGDTVPHGTVCLWRGSFGGG